MNGSGGDDYEHEQKLPAGGESKSESPLLGLAAVTAVGDDKAIKVTAAATPKSNKRKRCSARAGKKKPPDMPKRPLSAYNFFFREERVRILHEREEKGASAGGDGEKVQGFFATMGQTVAQRWKQLTKDELKKYEALAEADMQRYKEALNAYHLQRARNSLIATEELARKKLDKERQQRQEEEEDNDKVQDDDGDITSVSRTELRFQPSPTAEISSASDQPQLPGEPEFEEAAASGTRGRASTDMNLQLQQQVLLASQHPSVRPEFASLFPMQRGQTSAPLAGAEQEFSISQSFQALFQQRQPISGDVPSGSFLPSLQPPQRQNLSGNSTQQQQGMRNLSTTGAAAAGGMSSSSEPRVLGASLQQRRQQLMEEVIQQQRRRSQAFSPFSLFDSGRAAWSLPSVSASLSRGLLLPSSISAPLLQGEHVGIASASYSASEAEASEATTPAPVSSPWAVHGTLMANPRTAPQQHQEQQQQIASDREWLSLPAAAFAIDPAGATVQTMNIDQQLLLQSLLLQQQQNEQGQLYRMLQEELRQRVSSIPGLINPSGGRFATTSTSLQRLGISPSTGPAPASSRRNSSQSPQSGANGNPLPFPH